MAAFKFTFYGNVQGIGFRAHVKKKAISLGISGWVKNMPDGSVSAIFSGDPEKISILEAYCRKVPLAHISSVESHAVEEQNFNGFEIMY
jgi:acylphosphatase